MRPILVAVLAGSLVLPRSAGAGLDLSWNSCVTASPADDLALPCASGSVSRLIANFELPSAMTQFVAVDGVIDFEFGGTDVPPFWHFEGGGCNESGIFLSDARPSSGCPSADNPTPWGTGGGASDAFLDAYSVGTGGPQRARMVVTIARPSSLPVTLAAGQNYYGFHLELFGDGAESCTGCATPGMITWSEGVFYSVLTSEAPITVTHPGRRSKSVTVNGGIPGLGLVSSAPKSAGNGGPATIEAYGRGIPPSAGLRLERTGQPSISGTGAIVAADGRTITAAMDLLNATAGPWDVVVENASSAARLEGSLDVKTGPLPTRVTPSVFPVEGSVSATIDGSGFQAGASVSLEKIGVFAIPAGTASVAADGRSIAATFTYSDARVGYWDLVVTNPDGARGRLTAAVYVDGPPVIARVAPDKGGERDVVPATINGINFAQGSTVALERAGDVIPGPSPLVAVDGRNIKTSFDLRGHAAGSWDLNVTSPSGLTARAAAAFTIVASPRIDSISPNHGTADGFIARIYGSGFEEPLWASLQRGGHGIVAQHPTLDPDGNITAYFASDVQGNPAEAGVYDLIVLNQEVAGDTLYNGFEYLPAPYISYLDPTGAPDNAPVTIDVHGNRLGANATVLLRRTGLDPDLIGTVIGSAPDGSYLRTRFDLTGRIWGGQQFLVRNENGLETTHPFTVFYTPRLDSISPAHAPNTGPVDVTIYGKPFETPMLFSLLQGGVSIPGLILTQLGSPSIRVRFNVLAAPAGAWDVLGIASNFGTRDTLPGAFQIEAAPQLDSIVPARGPNSMVQPVVFYGHHFASPLTVGLFLPAFRDSVLPTGPPVLSPDGRTASVSLDLRGKRAGLWDAYIELGGTNQYVPNAFEIVQDGPVATLLAYFEARSVEGAVELRWRFAPGRVRDVTLERAPTDVGPWSSMSGIETTPDGGAVARDLDPSPGPRRYRLRAVTSDGTALMFGPIGPDGGEGAPGWVTSMITPNPVRSLARIRLGLSREGPIRVAVHDLQGREVAALAEGSKPAGTLELTWEPHSGGSRLPAGLYFLSLEAGGVRQVRRLVLAP